MLKMAACLAAALLTLTATPSASANPTQEIPVTFAADATSLRWGPCPELFPAGCEIAGLHGDTKQENADIFLRVPANYTIPEHWHTSAERMVLVSGAMKVQYKGHKPMTLKKGMYAYGPAKLPHTAICLEGDDCVLFIAFEEPVDVLPAE